MTPREVAKLRSILGKSRRVWIALNREHRIDVLRDDPAMQGDITVILGEINRCLERKRGRSTYLGALSFATRSASEYFLRGEFSQPLSATRYIAYLFSEADSRCCRWQSDLEMFFWRFQNRLSKRFNSERRRAEKTRFSPAHEG